MLHTIGVRHYTLKNIDSHIGRLKEIAFVLHEEMYYFTGEKTLETLRELKKSDDLCKSFLEKNELLLPISDSDITELRLQANTLLLKFFIGA